MDINKVIKQLMLERDSSYKELADRLGIQEQSLRNKISRNSFTLSSFLELLDKLDCEIVIRTKDTKKEFS